MAVRKLTTGKWLCECYPAGRSGRRVRKQFATKGEALAFERHTMEETESKPWLGELDGFNFFTDCYFQFLSVMEKTSIVLPRGQLTHVLRHTFAAHFMMSGGNILALQKILGHHDIKMTMRYAHLAPDHLETALRFNPLATLPSGDKVAAAVGITP
ncbi:tyrosine-type recombinase/integrase [Escherichia coli]|uniref:tyrosine-type recombinase/integrase n=1 Tax=Escherichia coli TaxID=562 RepID=UPI0010DDDB86|nr:integrase [Escherichia coli]GDT84904.1 integrase [Escherichia coli]